MGLFSGLQNWLLERKIKRQFRYPSLAEANKALLAVEEEVVDFQQINYQMELYKQVLGVPETERDLAYIPVYLAIERYVIDHRPPSVKQALTKQQVRDKVRQVVNLEALHQRFRLIFLPDNEQADHLLKLGIIPMLQFLKTSLGHAQLSTLISRAAGKSPLAFITVSDDGIIFDQVHQQMRQLPVTSVLEAYQTFYQAVFDEVTNIFGSKGTIELVTPVRKVMEETYDSDLVRIYLQTLPDSVKPVEDVTL